MDGQFILACLFETLKLFQYHGLKTSLLVCDGSPANLTTIKATHGHTGAYSLTNDAIGDKFQISPWMINPFDPPNCIYWVVCPTHQVYHHIYYCNNFMCYYIFLDSSIANFPSKLMVDTIHGLFTFNIHSYTRNTHCAECLAQYSLAQLDDGTLCVCSRKVNIAK